MTSFKARIQYGAMSLILILLLLLDVGLYLGFERVLHSYVDTRLEAISESWADMIGDNAGLLLASLEQQGGTALRVFPEETTSTERIASIRVLSPEGIVLWKSPSILPPVLSKAPVPREVLDGLRTFETIDPGNGSPVRRVWMPIAYQGEVRYVLQAETAMRLMQSALRGLQILLAVGSIVVLGLAWVGSRWLARQSLMPIEALSTTAQNIAETSSLTPRLKLDPWCVEFQQLAEAFNSMMDRLQRAFEGQRRFVTDAAHELHTPLTALKGNLEVAFARNRSAQEYRETLIGNLASVDWLIHLCRSLITLAKLTGDELRPRMRPVQIPKLLREVIDELHVLAEDRQIGLSMEAAPVPDVSGHPEQLQRVFVNLIDNALRHTRPGGTVTGSVSAAPSHVLVSIADTGEGIASEHLPHIFDRFYRADQARSRDSGGVGLGLAIVKEIVEGHGGEIAVKSEGNKGTLFTIRLPIPSAMER
ncbi:MAG TPA: ATP-binding protein [Nitrospira sp.]|nr:ATP-binding protein [Nitrospira sp.]